jgi:beta-phosphoglucomutase-like phosphatase (HAD superfamily)
LFDLDGVLTQTAKLHAAAWKQMFDAFLSKRAARTGERFVPFDEVADYDEYVDGKPRYDGVRSFLGHAASSSRRVCRVTHPRRRRSAGSATARTTSSSR